MPHRGRPHRDRPHRDHDRDVYYTQPKPAVRPQAKVACGCHCGTCSGSGHCHNMGTGCNVR